VLLENVGPFKPQQHQRQHSFIVLRSSFMWYFTWILGVLLACSFGIINAMWLEFNGYPGEENEPSE
jgi:cyd operon protein YbgT